MNLTLPAQGDGCRGGYLAKPMAVLLSVLARVLSRWFDGNDRLSRNELEWLMSRYPSASFGIRLPLIARAGTLAKTFRWIARYVPTTGRVLDAGCGYGLVAHWLTRKPSRTVIGIDASPKRIEIARRSLESNTLRFVLGDVRDAFPQEPGPWAGVLLIDVLMYLEPEEQGTLLRKARRSVRDDGVLLIRDSTTTPRWKYAYARFEERCKLRAGIYGNKSTLALTYHSLDQWRDLLRETGWRIVALERCGRWTPYPGWIAACHADAMSDSGMS